MRNIKIKINNFKFNLKRNGLNTEIRRLINYIKYKNAVPDEFEEWSLLNEPNNKEELERQKKYK